MCDVLIQVLTARISSNHSSTPIYLAEKSQAKTNEDLCPYYKHDVTVELFLRKISLIERWKIR